MSNNRLPLHVRFWSQVEQREGCWAWKGGKHRQGYGQIRANGKQDKAHRVSWALHFGLVPEGMCVLHSCDNPECTRPDHLWLGTHRDNMLDMCAKGRHGKLGSVGLRRLTEEQVADARARYAVGSVSQRQLASELGVSQPAVFAMLKRRNYAS